MDDNVKLEGCQKKGGDKWFLSGLTKMDTLRARHIHQLRVEYERGNISQDVRVSTLWG